LLIYNGSSTAVVQVGLEEEEEEEGENGMERTRGKKGSTRKKHGVCN